MTFLLDTNVVSEVSKPRPDKKVLTWLATLRTRDQHLSVLSFGEIYYGVQRLQPGSKRDTLVQWLDRDFARTFGNRLLPVTVDVARRWGELRCLRTSTMPAIDGLIAATALQHGLCLVTRNEKDFVEVPGLRLLNPWQ